MASPGGGAAISGGGVELGVCGYTRTRGYTRPDPYPRVRVRAGRRSTGTGRVGSGKCFTGTGIPAFTREKVPKSHNY